MYKLIAIDIDDTLLTDECTVTPGTKEALIAAMEKGVFVTLATGRMFPSARKIANQIELNVPIITYQGSSVKTLLDEQVLYERYVPQDAAELLMNYCEENNVHLQLYTDDIIYVREDNQHARNYSKLANLPFVVESDFKALIKRPTAKMLMIDDPARLDEVAADLRDLIGANTHITKSKPHFLEVTHKEGTKGHAISFMAQHIGCTMEEVIAIGDSWNDHEMIEVAGLGVAMGNAVQKLKDIAQYITKTNNEEGVRHVIEKFILQPETV
ncbi:Cof-type HAD-IIB family hydrolase [Paenibacillus sp. OV219]|uniref:Cof-type HAD-IIB family hydrolase n=1 Tax=Paenibacillus sp. OV219 TaxID=1884377 RepID=UPI0008D04E53|nr:Cof-type HAD-IIB family hydrolase [Paenibacillus sp. OV219]SEN84823.1 hypothetical protein SAMN05518847_104288 [Paenibacillus sp. OV219]